MSSSATTATHVILLYVLRGRHSKIDTQRLARCTTDMQKKIYQIEHFVLHPTCKRFGSTACHLLAAGSITTRLVRRVLQFYPSTRTHTTPGTYLTFVSDYTDGLQVTEDNDDRGKEKTVVAAVWSCAN
ncbi:unnamed protein product [Nesidiocoris tenuis]|uniref:Uncharacterized protein n=1 Tax=Nesidiocoris tenuis TaxID=355587 RepID=A0A6H5H141_9HEMI|nr:unnamed protein product [Nesidiocoris tenuis]